MSKFSGSPLLTRSFPNMATTWCSAFVLGCVISLCAATCSHGTIEAGVSSGEAQAIVDKHNQFRQMIMDGTVDGQPKGVNLNQLQWDESLASAAQDISNTCVFAHVPVQDPRFSVGQNLGWSASSAQSGGSDWDSIVQMWFDEYKNYHYPDNPGDNTGHYTQVVWADTQFVGCGYTFYQGDQYPEYPYEKLYVCNYGPAGNIIGQPPYQTA